MIQTLSAGDRLRWQSKITSQGCGLSQDLGSLPRMLQSPLPARGDRLVKRNISQTGEHVKKRFVKISQVKIN
jgi:hypothetical protein